MTSLSAQRCAQHADREAAAKCPGCGHFFCRECVVEHGGRLLCSACLKKASSVVAARHPGWRRAIPMLVAGLGVVLLWGVFYLLGNTLVKIPPEFHEGTIWRRGIDRTQ
jgi:hypothetical protein